MEELDYELEAQSQRAFARGYRRHPFIHVPDVVTRLSTERVLVSEWVDGAGFDEVRELPQAERDRFGEIVFRFCFGSIYHLQHFNADAHPGNYLLLPDGRVAFLDFGMTKHLDQDQIELEIAALEAIFDDDPERLRVALHDLGFLNDPRKVDAELLMDHVRAVGGWYMEDREVTIDSSRVMEAIAAVSDPRSDFYRVMRRENLPANELMGRRMESGVLAVLGQLNATRNWYRIGREWWFGEPPATELGEQERAWAGAQNSWFSPAKISETESSVKMRRIESSRMSAQVSWVIRSGRALAQRHRVGHDDAVQRSAHEVLERIAREEPVRGDREHALGALVEHGLRGGAERAARADDVVDDHRGLALHVTDHVADLGHLLGGPLLLHQRVGRAHLLRELAHELHAAGVGGDDHEVLAAEPVDHELGEDRHGGHVVHGLREEALELAGVEVHRHEPVDAGHLERVGHEAGGDRLARR